MTAKDTMVNKGNAGIHEGSAANTEGSSGNGETSPGQLLRGKRESLDFTVAYMAEHLRLTEAYIHYLENDDFNKLPSEPFVLGYYRSYARILGLAAEDVISLYRDYAPGHTQEQSAGRVAGKSASHNEAVNSAYRQQEGQRYQAQVRQQDGHKAEVSKPGGLGGRLYLIVSIALISIWVVASLLSETQIAETAGGAQATTAENSSRETVQENVPAESGAVKPLTADTVEIDREPLGAEPAEDLAKEAPLTSAADSQAEAVVENEEAGAQVDGIAAEPWPQPENVEPVIDTASEPAAAGTLEVADEPLQPNGAQAAGNLDSLAFTFSDDCWLDVKDTSGDVVASRLYQDGDTIELKGVAPFKVMLGNVRAAQLSLNGVQVVLTPNGSRKTLRTTIGVNTPVSE